MSTRPLKRAHLIPGGFDMVFLGFRSYSFKKSCGNKGPVGLEAPKFHVKSLAFCVRVEEPLFFGSGREGGGRGVWERRAGRLLNTLLRYHRPTSGLLVHCLHPTVSGLQGCHIHGNRSWKEDKSAAFHNPPEPTHKSISGIALSLRLDAHS